MKNKVIFFVILCMALYACNLKHDNKKVEKKTPDTVLDSVELDHAVTNDHLTFKGVPIDGTLNQYVVRMKKSGFALVGTEDGSALLCGDFAGYKGCRVYVSTIEGNDIVSYIVVQFPSQNTWEYLYGDYKNLKEMLTEKYGKPSSVKEEFQGYKFPKETDNDKMFKVKMDECKYETRFMTDKGEIVLWIEHDISTFVCLEYKDKINSNSVKLQAINDL